jgi:hypothetical protein
MYKDNPKPNYRCITMTENRKTEPHDLEAWFLTLFEIWLLGIGLFLRGLFLRFGI